MISNYLTIAKDDLEAAMILLKAKKFPQSLFYTNQSIEKICKYLIIKIDIIPEEKLKSQIGHNSTKVFDILVEFLLGNIDKTQNDDYSDFSNELRKGKEYLLKLREEKKSKDLDEKELRNQIKVIETLLFNNFQNSTYQYFFDNPDELLVHLKKMNLVDETELNQKLSDEKFKTEFLEFLKRKISEAPMFQNYLLALLSLASVFSSHWESTRYPTGINGLSPQEKFNEENTLIKNLKKFQELTHELIRRFEDLIIL